jgi:CRISPR/Cas system-associated exonuclease Cas4 (RecB family)
VRITPDFLEETTGPGGRTIQVLRFRTGRPTKSEYDKEIYAAYQAAMEKELHVKRTMKLFYLSLGESRDVPILSEKTRNKRLEKYDEAIAGIEGSRFSPEYNDKECPRCPHYFICPVPENA